jgi:hypothetical protein
MSRFRQIDDKLNHLARKLNATLTKDRPGYPWIFEERRIDWVDNQIKKAIIIQPTFELNGVNSSIWNLINIAWIEKTGVAHKPGWTKMLVDKQDFTEIENNIDELLSQSEKNLSNVKIEDVS